MKKSLTFLSMALLLLISSLGWAQTRAEEVYSTCLFGSSYNSQSIGSYTATWTASNGGFTWTIVNGNNNNNAWSYVKFGRKNVTSVGEIRTETSYDQAITKVDLAIDAITADKINSIKLYTSTDEDTWTEVSSFTKATGTQTATIASPATGLYYKIEFDCAAGSSNGLISVSKIEYYYNTGGATSPTISADDVEIAYNATSGEIPYTINNPVSGGVLSATSAAEWLVFGTADGETVPFTCEGNEAGIRTATVTLTYTYNGDNVTKNVTVTQAANPNGPGSLANPYTVAQARAAIDAGTGLADVYATGIISQVDSYNTNFNSITYWISDDGTTTDQLEVYSGKGLNNTDFTSIDDVEEGATVVVFGTLKKYGTTYEFDKNNYLVEYTAPVHDVETPTFTPVAGSYEDAQDVIISCATGNSRIYYTLDGTDPSEASTLYSSSIHVASYTTIKAIAYVNRVSSAIATATYHIVSAENPYTVAEALDFNEYPANGIYVHGIVSTAPTQSPTNNGELTYFISDNGEATDQLEIYKGKGLDNTVFSDQSDIQVGDIVTVFGNVVIYGSSNPIKEFAQGNYLVSWERPQSTEPSITVNPNSVALDAEEHDGTLDITYENLSINDMNDFGIQYYDANDSETETPEWIEVLVAEQDPQIGEGYVVSYFMLENEGEARTAYFKVFASDVYSNLVTVTQAAPVIDYATLPFEFDGGRADIETTDGLTQEGLGTDYGSAPKLKFSSTGANLILHFNEAPGILTYYIKGNSYSGSTFTVQASVDGVNYNDLQTYTTLGSTTQDEEIDLTEYPNYRYIKWIYTEKVSGNVALGNITLAKPVTDHTINVSPLVVDVDAEEHEGELTVVFGHWSTSAGCDIMFCDAEGNGTTAPNWVTANMAINNDGDYVVQYLINANDGEARTAYMMLYALDDDGETYIYSNLITISQAAYVAPAGLGDWVLTNLADITENDVFVIVGTDDDDNATYALPNDGTSAPVATAITIVGDKLSSEPAANLQWNLKGNTTEGFTFYPNNDDASWLFCNTTAASGSNNNIRVGNGSRNVFLLDDSDYLTTYDDYTTRYLSIYFNSGVAQDWRGYVNTNSAVAISFYKKLVEPETCTLDVNGYTAGDLGGYHLIATPVTVDPATVDGMTTNPFDLYYFDQAEDEEWRNYKNEPFELKPGKGYLYAKQATSANEVFHFTLTGIPYTGNGEIKLRYKDSGDFAGWNLIGNPFNEAATIDRDFFVMNSSGTEITTGSGTVEPMQGIFVVATADGEKATFSTSASTNHDSKIVINVSQNRDNVIDRTIVRVGNGRRMPKIMLNPNNTKLYIPQEGNDFAVVRSERSDRLPVAFKPAEDGDYIISVNTENLNLLYLRLIDHETGEVIDLLRHHDYKFFAGPDNKPERFELEYRTISQAFKEKTHKRADSEEFGYFSNGEIIVNGTGLIQVIDANGRIIKSETINGTASIQLNEAKGVYMLNLINGDSMKTQKVVVK